MPVMPGVGRRPALFVVAIGKMASATGKSRASSNKAFDKALLPRKKAAGKKQQAIISAGYVQSSLPGKEIDAGRVATAGGKTQSRLFDSRWNSFLVI